MKVILQRDIPKLGRTGDIVAVKDGYARNYLFPRAYAQAAKGGALKELNARISREKERGEKLLGQAQGDAGKLQDLTVTIVGKVGAGTKLYGSVTAQDVANAIQRERGVSVDKRRVGLVDPIKTVGVYTIPVRLHSDVSIPVTLDVTTEAELERRKVEAAKAEAAKAAAEAAAADSEEETPAEEDTGEAADGAEAESAGGAAEGYAAESPGAA